MLHTSVMSFTNVPKSPTSVLTPLSATCAAWRSPVNSRPWKTLIRDRVVCGIHDDATRHKLLQICDFRSNRQTRMKEVFDSQDRSRSNALSSPVHDIVLESHSLAPRTLDYSQSEVALMDSRPEVEADLNKISTRTHNPGLDLAPQCRESAVHAGAGSLLGTPQHGQSAWIVTPAIRIRKRSGHRGSPNVVSANRSLLFGRYSEACNGRVERFLCQVQIYFRS